MKIKNKIDLVILAGGKGSRVRKFLAGNPKPLLKIKDDTHEKGFISTSYWGPIDNVIIAEHENDILAVQTSNKLSTIWGKLKTGQ